MSEIITTKDYSIFTKLKGNRDVNEKHVIKLMRAFEKNYLKTPIFVNNKMEVIDGQHRLEAASRLGYPVFYYKVGSVGLQEVQQLNSTSKNWSGRDYLNCYCDLKTTPYLRVKEFMENYPEFTIGMAREILSEYLHPKDATTHFKEGRFKVVDDIANAYEIAWRLRQYKPYFPYYNSTAFIRVMRALYRNPKFDHDVFLRKLALQPTALVRCATMKQYKALIEDIYNFKSQSKVNLRIT
jgi:hypothetical protein